MKTIGVIILSRFNSTRLPGKALMEIREKPILKYILERISQVVEKSNIIIATSSEDTDDPIAKFASKEEINCYRGSLDNVSCRFLKASQNSGWDYTIRINGDNIFVDTDLLIEMINLAQTGIYDFISNIDKRTFPIGMSIEIVKSSFYLDQYHKVLENKDYKEHVMQHLYLNETGNTKYIYNTRLPEAAGCHLALDDQRDLKQTKYIIDQFKAPHWEYNLTEIYTILKNYMK
ncbi:hypothetical protein O4H26_13155 [Aequorivita viscosa]|nr:hypothetical protein [Aequorivita viscosa]